MWCIVFSGFFDEQKVQKNSIYLKYKSFCNIINVITVIFDQFNVSLLNKKKYWFIYIYCFVYFMFFIVYGT